MRKRLWQKFKNYFKHLPLAVLANTYWRFPSKHLFLIGVTGTDGKTTTVNLIYHLLHQAGFPVGMVSTVGAKLKDEQEELPFHVTSPGPWQLQRFLKRMVDKGLKFAVLEVTSHGLDQFRFWGCRFEIGVLTNVTHEHLDYHQTLKEYRKTKLKLLQMARWAVVNQKEKWAIQALPKEQAIVYGFKKGADYWIKETTPTKKGTQFTLREQATQETIRLKLPIPGEYNIENAAAAVAVARKLGIEWKIIQKALISFPGVIGRMEEVANKFGFKVFIDFAHTPNGLKNALTAARSFVKKGGRLIAVFGAAGLRDYKKRPKMGKIAADLADLVVLTAEDPRTEDVNQIIAQIAKGCRRGGLKKGEGYFTIPSRQEAINFAIRKLAKPGDVVIICGKGHERSMCYGKTEYPWSEHQAVKTALEGRRK